MQKIAVLISNVGTGSNLKALIGAQKSKKINTQIVCVISDTQGAYGLVHAKKNKIQIEICPEKEKLFHILEKYNPDFVCLAGWKQMITDDVIKSFENRIINLHPGLIPDKFNDRVKNPDGTDGLWNRGLLADKAVSNFLIKKATYAGSSLHFITSEFDFGPVLNRVYVRIKKSDTVESLYKRLKKKEHEMYVKTLKGLTVNRKANVLVIDGGGRGHAIAKKYLESSKVEKVLAIPGNDLMQEDKIKIFSSVKTSDNFQILNICKNEQIDLVDVCQDNAIASGLVDFLIQNGFRVFGPTKEAGQIEWDKAWSRSFMKNFKIPSPDFKICNSQKEGISFLRNQKNSAWYVKASGLAAGKGALFAKNNKEAVERIHQMKNFESAGTTYLIEEALVGEEFSSFAIIDGPDFQIIGHAQDHKTVYNADLGPNTGGMGCTSPPLLITKEIEREIKSIFKKAAEGLVSMNRPYRGILYLGGIVTVKNRVSVIEFNARWGDPEAQVIIPGIENDFYEVTDEILKGNIKEVNIKTNKSYRVVVTLAAKGYPLNHSEAQGSQIFGLNSLKNIKRVKIYGAGTRKTKTGYQVAGGRLFYILSVGKNIHDARKKAYDALSQIYIEGNNGHYRTDIGYRDLERFYNSNAS